MDDERLLAGLAPGHLADDRQGAPDQGLVAPPAAPAHERLAGLGDHGVERGFGVGADRGRQGVDLDGLALEPRLRDTPGLGGDRDPRPGQVQPARQVRLAPAGADRIVQGVVPGERLRHG
jgi:hypothetical protein